MQQVNRTYFLYSTYTFCAFNYSNAFLDVPIEFIVDTLTVVYFLKIVRT